MNGYYGIPTWLTYLNMIFGVMGVSCAFRSNISTAIVCLIISGICDMFDGTVAKCFKRSNSEKSYGIQIDSLADVISFGVLPGAIGLALGMDRFPMVMVVAVYILAALIRLAYFNVTEMVIQSSGNQCRTFYEGLPVTSVAIIIPFTYLLSLWFNFPLPKPYGILLAVIAVLFVSKFHVQKLKIRTMLALGAVSIPVVVVLIIKVVMRR